MGAGFVGIASLTSSVRGEKEEEGEVAANEDLMREHRIIRRALFV